MSWGAYAILVVFGAFVLLLILNPNLSCFGKRIRSPFYPLRRKREMKKAIKEDLKRKMTDYKFDLDDAPDRRTGGPSKAGTDRAADKKAPDKKTDDYGFRLD
ncbi:MAG: hypothetical protein ABR951_00690 [Candidatus Aminicenantales bacterium]|jgi:hypothetical protein